MTFAKLKRPALPLGPAGLMSAGLTLILGVGCKGSSSDDRPTRTPAPAPPLGPAPAPSTQPRVSQMIPASGAAGTEVTLVGGNLQDITEVRLNGAKVQGVRLVGPERLVIPIAQGMTSGTFHLTARGGGEAVSVVFTVAATPVSRRAFLTAPIVQNRVFPGDSAPELKLHPNHPGFHLLDCPEPMRTNQYRLLYFPKAPIFHAYHPFQDNVRDGKVTGTLCTLAIKLPPAFQVILPSRLSRELARLGFGDSQVDLFCVSQDMPYADDTQYLFRPHSWTDPEAPDWGTYAQTRNVEVGLYGTRGDLQFVGHHADAFFPASITVHGPGQVVSSPNNLRVDLLDHKRSRTFWSLTRMGNRAAATLHLLLEDTDQAHLEALASSVTSFQDLLARVEASPLAGTPAGLALKGLMAPRIYGVSLDSRVEHGLRELTLHGSGFTGATQVEVLESDLTRAVQATAVDVQSDTLLKAKVPDATGRLAAVPPCTVTTPLGGTETGPEA